jgi:hypothetical protein
MSFEEEIDYDSNVYYRPFLVGGVDVFGNGGKINYDVLDFIDNRGKLIPSRIVGLTNPSILENDSDIILSSSLPGNLETMNESLFTTNNVISSSFLPENLKVVDDFLLNPNEMNPTFLPANVEIFNNELLISNTQINPSFLPANVQIAENLLSSPTQINRTFLSDDLNLVNNTFLVDSNTQIEYNYYTANLVNMNENLLTDPGNVNYEYLSNVVEYIDKYLIDEDGTINLDLSHY